MSVMTSLQWGVKDWTRHLMKLWNHLLIALQKVFLQMLFEQPHHFPWHWLQAIQINPHPWFGMPVLWVISAILGHLDMLQIIIFFLPIWESALSIGMCCACSISVPCGMLHILGWFNSVQSMCRKAAACMHVWQMDDFTHDSTLEFESGCEFWTWSRCASQGTDPRSTAEHSIATINWVSTLCSITMLCIPTDMW